MTVAVQVNGKLRGQLEAVKDADQDQLQQDALVIENVQKFIADKTVRKVIVVPNKIVNIVVG